MTTKNIKTAIFGALIVALILPFSGMGTATAQSVSEDQIDLSKVKTELKAPRMLTEGDISVLAPKYMALEQTRNSLVDSSQKLTAADKVLLTNTEEQMTSILERVVEHKQASRIALEMPAIDKKRMELAVEEIIQSDIPFSHVGVNPHTKTVMVGIVGDNSLASYETQINAITSIDVPLTIYKGEYAKDETCTSQTGVVCDPVVAGIQIEWANGLCTLSLEVKEGWWSWANVGWLTAGHCYPVGANGVDQPSGNNDIADVTNRDFVHNGDCDCEFMDKTTTRTSGSQMWLSSNTYKSVTSKGDPAVNDWVLTSLSSTGGTDWGQVWLTEQSITNQDGITTTGMTLVTGVTSQGGDSGAPYMQLFGNQYHGIHKTSGTSGGTAYTAFTPWSNINPSLGVW